MIMKLILAICSIAVVTAVKSSEEEFPDETQTDSIYDALDNLLRNSWHVTQKTPSDLNLSPADLKLFTTQAFNMFHSKCPSVGTEKLVKVNRLINKILATDINGKEGAYSGNQRLQSLVTAMKTCTTVIEKPSNRTEMPAIPGDAKHFTIFHPNALLIIYKDNEINSANNATGSNGTDMGEVNGTHRASVVVQYPKETTLGNMANWVSSILNEIKYFFTDTVPNVFVHTPSYDEMNPPIYPWNISWSDAQFNLRNLVDQVCRVYCAKCKVHSQVRNLRMAASELLQYLLKDKHVALGVASLLDDDILKTMAECEQKIIMMPLNELLAFSNSQPRPHTLAKKELVAPKIIAQA